MLGALRRVIREALSGCPKCGGKGKVSTGFYDRDCMDCRDADGNELFDKPSTKKNQVGGNKMMTCSRENATRSIEQTKIAYACHPEAVDDMEQIIVYANDDGENIKCAHYFLADDGNLEAIIDFFDSVPMNVVYDFTAKLWFAPTDPRYENPGDPFRSDDWNDPDIRIV